MRILLISLLVLMLGIPAYAEDIFPDKELKELRVVEANRDEEVAWIVDNEGNEAEVVLEDAIGVDGGIVIEIDDASIILKIGDRKTKMLVIHGFIVSQD